jgi:hypothetical protein
MRSYPSWNLRILEGTDGMYQSKAQQGDPDYIKFWDRVLNSPTDSTYKSVEEGLDFLIKDRSVMHISQGILKGYFKANPYRQQKLKIFAKERPIFDR